jgi:CCR4-NOT transcription complex subunit 7/8
MPVEGLTGKTHNGETLRVREVWEDNLLEEIVIIRNIVEEYPFIAMDTEFPGVVARPVGQFKSTRDYQYRALKLNVDMLKLIQLGLTFTDAQGNLPVCDGEHTVWQFNFRGFKLNEDVYAQDSIELLKQSGIDFNRLQQRGIDVQVFGELLMSSGIVLNEDIRWITFHSGYDFGYLLKVLTAQPLPDSEAEFFDLLKVGKHAPEQAWQAGMHSVIDGTVVQPVLLQPFHPTSVPPVAIAARLQGSSSS